MQGTKEDIDNAIAALIEKELIVRIRNVYEDVTITSATKKSEREQITRQFIEILAERTVMPKDRVRNIVDRVIAQTKWIEEIEKIDEELEDER